MKINLKKERKKKRHYGNVPSETIKALSIIRKKDNMKATISVYKKRNKTIFK